jgi:hypothetical protein
MAVSRTVVELRGSNGLLLRFYEPRFAPTVGVVMRHRMSVVDCPVNWVVVGQSMKILKGTCANPPR